MLSVNPFKKLVSQVHILALKARYDIHYHGFNELDLDPNYGILFLQNHTTHIDPVFTLGSKLHNKEVSTVHVWASDFVYKIWYMKIFNRWLSYSRYLKVPHDLKKEIDCEKKRAIYKKQLNKLFQRSADCLNNKKNVLIHPSGHSKRDPFERIIKTKGVSEVLKRAPKTNIVIIRHTGLWGSRFSQASKYLKQQETGNPNWKNESKKWYSLFVGITKMFIGNAIFFMPKRRIDVEFYVPKDFPRKGTPDEINQYLEEYFNRQWGQAGEKMQNVPNYFWQTAQDNEPVNSDELIHHH